MILYEIRFFFFNVHDPQLPAFGLELTS